MRKISLKVRLFILFLLLSMLLAACGPLYPPEKSDVRRANVGGTLSVKYYESVKFNGNSQVDDILYITGNDADSAIVSVAQSGISIELECILLKDSENQDEYVQICKALNKFGPDTTGADTDISVNDEKFRVNFQK